MADGTKLRALERTLEDIQATIFRHPAFAKGAGNAPDSKSYVKDLRAIEALEARLAVAIRELENELHLLDFRDQVAQRYPREQRWRMRQSVGDKRRGLRRLYELALNTQAGLRDLSGANARISAWDVMGKLAKAGEKVAAEVVAKHKGHYDALQHGSAVAQNIPMAFILAVLLGQMIVLRLRAGGDGEARRGTD